MADEFVTKDDLQQVKEELRQALDQAVEHIVRYVDSRIGEAQKQTEDRLTEKMRDMQSEILRGFDGWVRPMEIRTRHIQEHAQRLAWVEDRVSEIERRINLGGQR